MKYSPLPLILTSSSEASARISKISSVSGSSVVVVPLVVVAVELPWTVVEANVVTVDGVSVVVAGVGEFVDELLGACDVVDTPDSASAK